MPPALIESVDDHALVALMTNLGGHCAETLIDAFDAAGDDHPTLFIAYTANGFGLRSRVTRTTTRA